MAVELETFDRAEKQRRGMKYVRQTDTEDDRTPDPKKQVEITNDDELQHSADLKKLVEELKIVTEENKKKEGTNLKELVDLIKQDRKETRTNKDEYSMKNSPNFNNNLKKKYFVCRMKITLQTPARRNQSVIYVKKLDIILSSALKENIRQSMLKRKNDPRKRMQ